MLNILFFNISVAKQILTKKKSVLFWMILGCTEIKKAMQKGSHVYFQRIFPRCFPQLASATHASFLCDNISL